MGPAVALAPEAAAAAAPAAKGATDILAPAAFGAGAADAAAVGAPLSILPEAATAGLGAAAPVAGEFGALGAGLATEPAFAPAVIGASIPGFDTTAAGIGIGLEGAGGLGAPLGAAANSFAAAPGAGSLDNLAATGNTAGALPGGGAPIGTTGAPGTAGGVAAPGTATGATTVAAPPGIGSPLSLDPTAAAGAAGGATPAAGGASPSIASMLSPQNLATGAVKSITSNPIGTALAFGGLGFSALNKPQTPNTQALADQASQLNEQGKQLASYLQNGNLPPGLKAALDQATSSAKTNIISNFAARGLSTDPSKNTALAQELQAVDTQAVISTAQIGQGLLTTGINETNMSSQLYQTLAGIDQANTDRISKSIANFAAAMSPSKGFTVNLGNKTG